MTAFLAGVMLALWRCPLWGWPVMACPGGGNHGNRSLIVWLIVGALAGWLAGLIVKGYGFGLIGNIVVGIIGAVIAGWLLPRLGVSLGRASLPP